MGQFSIPNNGFRAQGVVLSYGIMKLTDMEHDILSWHYMTDNTFGDAKMTKPDGLVISLRCEARRALPAFRFAKHARRARNYIDVCLVYADR